MKPMRIAIIGAGAMGCLYGGYLARSGQDVLLVSNHEETVRSIQTIGIMIEEPDQTINARPAATVKVDALSPVDLIIVLVKTPATHAALLGCRPLLGPDTLVMTLQNGFGNADDLARFVPIDRMIVGTSSHGSELLGPGHIRHTGLGPTLIGAAGALSADRLETVAQVLRAAGFETRVEVDVQKIVWKKLFINAAINPVTALLGIANGKLVRHAETRDLMRSLIFEAVAVAAAKGYDFTPELVFEICIKAAEKTCGNHSSMLQDIRRGRPTEIRRMNGMIADMGDELGIPVPCNRMISQLVLMREKSG